MRLWGRIAGSVPRPLWATGRCLHPAWRSLVTITSLIRWGRQCSSRGALRNKRPPSGGTRGSGSVRWFSAASPSARARSSGLAIVTSDVPEYEIWGGVPARRLKDRFTTEQRLAHRARLDSGGIRPRFAEPEGLRRAPSAHLRVHDGPPVGRRSGQRASFLVHSFLSAGDHVTWIGPDRSFFVLREDRDMRVDYRLVRTGRGRWGRIRSMWALRRLLSSVEDVDWVYTPDPDAALLVKSVRHPQVLLDIHEEYHKGHLTQSAPVFLLRLAEPTVRAAITAIGRSCTLVTAVNETHPQCVPRAEVTTAGNPEYASDVVRRGRERPECG